MIVFENEFSAIIRQTQTIYDCNRLPSLCSNLLRPFDPPRKTIRGQYRTLPGAEVVVPVAARQTYLHSVDLEVGVQLFCLFYLFKKQVCVGLTN